MNAFHVFGVLFGVWAVIVTAIGIRSEGFPRLRGQARLVGAVSLLLALGTISSAVLTSAAEDEEKEEEGGEAAAEPAREAGGAAPEALRLSADPGGDLEFDKLELEAKAGKVTIAMRNPSPVEHDVSLEGRGVDERGKVVQKGGTSTVTAELDPGEYTFYCSVPGHRQGGMEGALTVR
jgi:plastocyanin